MDKKLHRQKEWSLLHRVSKTYIYNFIYIHLQLHIYIQFYIHNWNCYYRDREKGKQLDTMQKISSIYHIESNWYIWYKCIKYIIQLTYTHTHIYMYPIILYNTIFSSITDISMLSFFKVFNYSPYLPLPQVEEKNKILIGSLVMGVFYTKNV